MNEDGKKTFKIINPTSSVEEAYVREIYIALLAAGDGVEVMRHKMRENTQWTLLPETETGEFQYYFLIRGELQWHSERDSGKLSAGESLVLNASNEVIELTANQETEYLFFCSKPIFQRHVAGLRDMEQLAISIEQKDGYTSDHCSRIQQISMQIADVLGLSPREKFDLNIGAFLHDVGKVRIPTSILNKADALTTDEWRIMKLHTVFGKDMVLELNQFCLLGACKVIEHHHERYNGSGYPYGLWKDEIHKGAAIVAVADSFDAMVTDRVYRKGRPIDEAIYELKQNRGILFDPEVIDAFLTLGFDK